MNPYLAFETIENMRRRELLPDNLSQGDAMEHYRKAIGKGLLKTMSKMGISTISSYIGAQIFEAVGLADDVIEEFFTGTVSRIGGIDLETIEHEVIVRHTAAYIDMEDQSDLELGGLYQWRLRGERHLHNPETIQKLQHAAQNNDYALYREYARRIDDSADARLSAAQPAGLHHDARADRGGRACRADRQTLRQRRHVLRIDLVGSPHDPGHRHEPARRKVEHGRRR